MTTYPREMLKAGAAVICRCEGAHGIAMTHAEIAAAVLDATLGLSPFELDVILERRRQVAEEGWTPEHDDTHSNGEIALAAACYAWASTVSGPAREALPYSGGYGTGWQLSATYVRFWRWPREWFKPTKPRRDLVKSGALVLAGGDQLDRAAMREVVPG